VQAHISKTYEKKRASDDDMYQEDNQFANTTGIKDRKRKNPINTILLSDENPDQPKIGQYNPPEAHDGVMNMCP
jgi:hypothetical protein